MVIHVFSENDYISVIVPERKMVFFLPLLVVTVLQVKYGIFFLINSRNDEIAPHSFSLGEKLKESWA